MIWVVICLVSSMLCAKTHMELRQPTYRDGKLETVHGGVISKDDFFLKADRISYRKSAEGDILHAEGNVLARIGKKYLVAQVLQYNVKTKEGVAEKAILLFQGVYIGAETVLLGPKGTITAKDVWASTSDYDPPEWSVRSHAVEINEDREARLDKVTFQLGHTPVFWFPTYTIDLVKKSKAPLITWRVLWESGQGPLAIMRYRLWDDETLHIFWRLEA